VDGAPGPQGPKGDPGLLASFDAVAGLACTLGGRSGTVALAWDSTARAVISCVVPTSGPRAVVRINELMTGSSSSAANEFVELVNAGTAPADIGGWKLVYRSATATSDVTLVTIPTGTTLPAGGFYLAGGAAYAGAPAADAAFSTGLAAAGGAVGLRDGAGALVDSLGYGTATNALVETTAASAPAAGQSTGRHPDGQDTNDNAADFTIGVAPTPRAAN
jgi:hypothetical protein